MAYTEDELSTGLDTLTDSTVAAGDLVIVGDVSDSGRAKGMTWTNIKAFLKTYFDTLYPSGSGTSTGTNTGDQTTVSGNAGTVTVADAGGDTTTWPLLGTGQTGSLAPATDAGLTYNASTNALTATTFVGALTGNVTGNVTGTAATVTTAAQPAITSLGTLTTLTVDDITVNGNTISSAGASTLAITPTAGQAITFDGTVTLDAGVIAGATSITSTTFVGAMTGNATTSTNTTGNAATVTTNANLTGHVTSTGNAAVLGSFTLAQLNTAVSDADVARVDAANTFVGASTASAWVLTSPTVTTKLNPTTDDGAPLGDTTHNWSDLFLASGAVENFANSNVVVTHSSGVLTMGTGTYKITNPTNTATSVVTIDGTQTLTNKTITSPTLTTPSAFTTGGTITLAENTSIALDPAGSADGKYSGITITGTAGAALTFGDLCYLAVADSRWELCDADAIATSGHMLGMCVLAAGADGNATTMLLLGVIRSSNAGNGDFPALTVGAPVYVGEAAGKIQVAIPTGADAVIRVVGFALTTEEIYFNPSQDNQTVVA